MLTFTLSGKACSLYTSRMKISFKYIAFLSTLLTVAVLSGCFSNQSTEQGAVVYWLSPQKGIEYANVPVGAQDVRKEFFVVKIDPALFEFRIFQNSDETSAKTLQEIHKQENSLLTFNGAFFDTKFKAMGLLQDSLSILHSKSSSQLMNGVFFVASKITEFGGHFQAGISHLENIPQDNKAFMIQNGPILLDYYGKISIAKDTQKLASRTALGVDSAGKVVLIILHQNLLNTDNVISLYQFAHLLKEDDFFSSMGLHDVLNLDGGPSTGVVVGDEYLPELSPVENAVFVLPRGAKI